MLISIPFTDDISPTRMGRLGMLERGKEVTQRFSFLFFFLFKIKLISLKLSGLRDTYFKIMELSKFYLDWLKKKKKTLILQEM